MNYVVGFVFDESMNRIALIEKNRPDWQKRQMEWCWW